MQGRIIQPVDRAGLIRKDARRNDLPRIELHVLIAVVRLARYLAAQAEAMIPDVEILAVPVAPDQELRRHSDAADVVRHVELEFQLQSSLAAFLNNAAALRTILGHWDPERLAIGRDAARVEADAIADFSLPRQLAGGQREFLKPAFSVLLIHRRYP